MVDTIDKTNQRVTVNVKQAIEFLRKAWDEVTPKSIRHCWGHTQVFLPEKNTRLKKDEEAKEYDAILSELGDLLKELEKKTNTPSVPAKDFIEIDSQEPIEQEQTDAEIVESVLGELPSTDESESDSDEKEEPVDDSPINHVAAERALKQVIKYFEQHVENESACDLVWRLSRTMRASYPLAIVHQSTIDSYFLPQN